MNIEECLKKIARTIGPIKTLKTTFVMTSAAFISGSLCLILIPNDSTITNDKKENEEDE